jgi:hypothetical protein
MFLGIITLIGDTKSQLGFFLFDTLTNIFGLYYIWVFSPVLIILSIFLFKEKSLHFNSYRAFGLLFFYISITTLLGWYFIDYTAYLNLYPTLENILGRNPLFFSFILLFFISLYILFRFSIVHATLDITQKTLPNIKNIKDNFSADKKYTQAKRLEKSTQSAGKRVTAEEKKIAKESSHLDKQLEELKKEKEALAKMKQPKQLQLEKQQNRKVEVS